MGFRNCGSGGGPVAFHFDKGPIHHFAIPAPRCYRPRSGITGGIQLVVLALPGFSAIAGDVERPAAVTRPKRDLGRGAGPVDARTIETRIFSPRTL